MKCCRVQVYIAGKGDRSSQALRAAMSYQMALEEEALLIEGYEWVWPITGSVSLYQGFCLVRRLQELLQQIIPSRGKLQPLTHLVQRWVKKQRWLKQWELEFFPEGEARAINGAIPLTGLTDDLFQRQLLALLRGRSLFLTELESGLQEMGLIEGAKEQIRKKLIPLLVSGQVEMIPATLPDQMVCLRCGERELELSQCGICGEMIWYCPQCAAMGEALSCRPLFRRADQARLGRKVVFPLEVAYTFPLSDYQQKLSTALVQGFRDGPAKDWLLWAVCGAGKTETTFGVMGEVLSRGGRVLFTSPRREVVRQMVERLGCAFPQVGLVGIYGSSEEKFTQGQLTVATVHQLARFYSAFDLIIFDEVDAFPYKGDPRLKALVERSRKADGQIIYLSATPDTELLAEAEQGRVEMLTLPARFHGKGVPVPELKRAPLPKSPQISKMPREVVEWIRQSMDRDLAQLFIFLPTRQMVEEFGEALIADFAERGLADWVQYTHSQDVDRSRKVEEFLQGEYPVLVTSTVMERGVTVPKSNVLVLYADYEQVFNYQSLIQMAGRAGRSQWAPDGNVWFVGRRVGPEMRQAREWIIRMNQEAAERGLLDEIDQ